MEQVIISKDDEHYIKVKCPAAVAQELYQQFSYDIPNWRWTPMGRKGYGDGKMHLFNRQTGRILAGLRKAVEAYCHQRGCEIIHDGDFADDELSLVEAQAFIDRLNLPFEPHDFQLTAFVKSVREKRRLTLLPTGSGKSLVIYMLSRWYNAKQKRVLVIVPTLTLIHQMASDFVSYGGDPSDTHKVFGGQQKTSQRMTWVSTWQSISKMPAEWFKQFDVVIGDEAHGFTAKEMTSILTKMSHCGYRFGVSGTLDGSKCHEMSLTGLFGPIRIGARTKNLIDRGVLSDLKLKVIVLKHPRDVSVALRDQCETIDDRREMYRREMNYLISCERRNNFIRDLALEKQCNTIVLFQFVEKHGNILYQMIKEAAGDSRKVFYVHGGVDGEDRDRIRHIIEKETNAIVVANRATFGTGVNIKNIGAIIFASPLKAAISNLQSIGRGLRKLDGKQYCTLYDIADDLSVGKYRNITLKHLDVRLETYDHERFDYKQYKVAIK